MYTTIVETNSLTARNIIDAIQDAIDDEAIPEGAVCVNAQARVTMNDALFHFEWSRV